MTLLPPAQQAAEHQQSNPIYVCDACSEPVIVFNGRVFRTCEHHDAKVVLNLSATVEAIGGLQQGR